jgi:hypothetical protein
VIAERRLVEAFIETLGIHIPADLVERINSPIDCRELRCDPPGLVPGQHIRLPCLVFVLAEIGARDRLPVGVLNAERLLDLAERPGCGCGKTAGAHRPIPVSSPVCRGF